MPDPDFYVGHTPLTMAVAAGQLDIVESLLENGASTNVVDERNLTPLIHIPYPPANRVAIVRALLGHGAKSQGLGFPALITYAAAGDDEVVALLIKTGADVNVRAEDGRTP